MNNTSHLNLITAAFNRPLALEAGYARTFFSALSQRLGNVQQLVDIEGNVLRAADMKKEASSFSPRRSTERSYQVVNGIAVIPIDGSLVHKYGYIKPYSGMTGYDGIMYRLREALADPEVKAVMLDMNTPGGMVAGCFDLADKIAEYRKIKPIWSLGYDMHCSAGQMIASACSRRLITQTGVAGSVGVIMAHTNIEKMLDQQGVEITLITAGSHKADGNPYQALPKDVREKWQKELESNRQMFASKAATYMGIDIKQVLATEAETYEGQAAVDIGFANEVVNGLDAVQIMSDHFKRQSTTVDMGAVMSVEVPTQANAVQTTTAAAQSTTTTAEAPTTEGTVTAPSAALAAAPESEPTAPSVDAAQAERNRCMGILALPEAKGRQELAMQLASGTNLSVEEAKGILAAAGKTTPDANSAALAALGAEHGEMLGQDVSTGSASEEQKNISRLASSFSRID
ncbi:S49 family peptidase [Vibrio vulnificus]|uniref:S49 family peptidase n=1 Tax=Vibrio vulnificus TaxID=672 RepID=UPI000C7D1089|nr:S49 family peptidase [Vibrio vulnificus]AUL97487.1 Head-tail preconnector protein GP5 [Vibrio vulnificus]